MSAITILFGTESGNAELVAEDIAADLDSHDVDSVDMSDFDIAGFDEGTFYIVVCSTHGEGELPSSARPLFASLTEQHPDLSGLKYAVFGLGDSSYDNYSHGSEIVDQLLTSLGAVRVGVYGRHDASDGSLPNDDAVAWARTLAVPSLV
jgi:MioC protein